MLRVFYEDVQQSDKFPVTQAKLTDSTELLYYTQNGHEITHEFKLYI